MVALGWMIILWMGGVCRYYFGEKMWLRGAKSTGIGLAIIGIIAMLGLVTIPAGMNNTGDSNDMHTSILSHNYKKDDMIGMNQNANSISSSTKRSKTITTEKMSNMMICDIHEIVKSIMLGLDGCSPDQIYRHADELLNFNRVIHKV
jgi:hypothetical protein